MLFDKRIAIQAPVKTRTPSGQVIEGDYETVVGKESLPARIVAVTEERRGEQLTVIEDRFDVLVGGMHPDLTPDMVVLDGQGVYNILRVIPAGRRSRPITQLVAQLVAI